ncbi:DUF4340 domain-containing protein [Bryobacter aggregatus]|uniref:DUF4340 domain-containing protein n=1 Tax=Bryobacter aggregatus TaxID=360054 RepID=UPI0004E1A7E7|nr:DUF4340 domain-containing protein [Bryobacter aggregatus]
MQSRGLLIGVSVLAVLCGWLWWSDKKADEAAKNPAKDAKTVRLTDLKTADLVEITVQHAGAPAVQLRKNGALWALSSEPKFAIENDAAVTLATNAASISSDKVVDDNANDLLQYGLDPGQISLEIKDKSGKTEKLLFGDETPVGNLYYVRKPGEKKVFTVPNYIKQGIDKSATDLRDKRLLLLDDANVSRLEVIRKGETLAFDRDKKGTWQLSKPQSYRTDTVVVDGLYNKLREAKLDPASTAEQQKTFAAQFAAGSPVATLQAVDGAGTQKMEVRKSKENLFLAKSSAVPGVYKISEELGAALDKTLEDFRSKKLLDFGFEDPTRIQIVSSGKTTLLEHKGEDWLLNGKKAEASTVHPVLEALRGFSAMKFVKAGLFTTPVFEVSITQSDAKTTEKLLVSKAGNFHYAKREGDSAEYEIDPKTLSDLEDAVKNVKEPGAVPKK